MSIDELYKEVILDHYKSPRNKREVPDAPLSCHRNNPLCGDDITVTASVAGGVIEDIAFQGQGCSISLASASMMTEAVRGKTVEAALSIAGRFGSMMSGDADPSEEEFGELIALEGVVKYPVRVKCAMLAWDVLREALSGTGASAGTRAHGL